MNDKVANKSIKGRHKVRIVAVSGPPADMRSSYDRIQWALDTIMEESEKNGGIYPALNRKPTLSNVLVRAGLPRSFLEKRNVVSSERDLRNAKLKTAINKRLGSPQKILLLVPDKNNVPEGRLVRELKEGWHEAELDLVQANADIRTLRAQLEKVGQENLDLREKMSVKKLIDK
ncbi:hypothetical protein [Rhizobium sp. 768_B6_N1_8]|uniref:hypothetical protein n=1 Tax=unclassified Rhizobium TaxID=2613769 RepID=UPI003F24F346